MSAIDGDPFAPFEHEHNKYTLLYVLGLTLQDLATHPNDATLLRQAETVGQIAFTAVGSALRQDNDEDDSGWTVLFDDKIEAPKGFDIDNGGTISLQRIVPEDGGTSVTGRYQFHMLQVDRFRTSVTLSIAELDPDCNLPSERAITLPVSHPERLHQIDEEIVRGINFDIFTTAYIKSEGGEPREYVAASPDREELTEPLLPSEEIGLLVYRRSLIRFINQLLIPTVIDIPEHYHSA